MDVLFLPALPACLPELPLPACALLTQFNLTGESN